MDEVVEEKRTVISEASSISMGLFLVLIGSIAGGVFYVATSQGKQESILMRIEKVETKQEHYNEVVQEMREDLKEIKGYVKGRHDK